MDFAVPQNRGFTSASLTLQTLDFDKEDVGLFTPLPS